MVKRCCAQSCFNSQLTNRNISYFGFPKYIAFAQEWAEAASRTDLLEKKLESITKYFLCAEHFTDDCFLDPPYNTRLKKTHHPLVIPIPTVFKSNFQKYVPCNSIDRQVIANTECKPNRRVRFQKYVPSNLIDRQVVANAECKPNRRARRNISNVPNNPTPSSTNISLLNKDAILHMQKASDTIILNVVDDGDVNYLTSVYSHDGISDYCLADEYDPIIEEDHVVGTRTMDETVDPNVSSDPLNVLNIMDMTCRLCASSFCSQNELCNVFGDADLLAKINQLLPEMITPNDELPHSICEACIHKVNACVDTLDSFRVAQERLKTVFTVESDTGTRQVPAGIRNVWVPANARKCSNV